MNILADTTSLELLPDVILLVDGEGLIHYVNNVCEALLGWKPEELRGQPVERLVPGRFTGHAQLRRGYAEAPSRRAMKPGLELYALHRCGEEVPVDILLNPVQHDGRPHVLVSIRDSRQQREVIRQLHILSVAVQSAATGVVITNTEGRIVSVNPAVTRLTGYSEAELVGNTPRLLKSGHHDEAYYRALWQTVNSGAVWRGQIINRRKDGSEYHEEQTIAPVMDRQGQVIHFIAIKQDVTERVLAEQALREARDELALRVAEVEALHALLREQAIRDVLTGLHNRRYLDETLPRELSRAVRDGQPITLVMLDIDHFKQINDSHGHAHGDRVLSDMGQLLRGHSRQSDIACRYGGEEFVMVLVNATAEEARQRAEDWRHRLSQAVFEAGEQQFSVTVSAGIAQWLPGEQAAELFARADTALYRAKHAGRNCVISCSLPA